MTEDHDDGDPAEYDPEHPDPPLRAPPVRRTAPQSEFTMAQVALGLVVLLVGAVVTVGLPLVL